MLNITALFSNPSIRDKKNIIGYVLAITSAILVSIADVVPKPFLEGTNEITPINPLLFVVLIYVVNSIFFTSFTKKTIPIKTVKKKNIMFLILIGFAEAIGTLLYYIGLKDTTATNASILGNSETLFAIILVFIIFGEKLHKKEIIPFLFVIVGTSFLPIISDMYSGEFNVLNLIFADVLILVSGLLYSFDVTMSKYVSKKVSSIRIMQIMSIAGSAIMLCFMIFLQIPFDLNIQHIPIIIIAGIFGTGISSLFFIMALKLIGATRTILLFSSTTIFGILFSWIYLGEQMTIFNMVSVVMVIFGIYFLRNKICND
jgi:drug/metabolite transporter (DMT)-like permease